MLSSPNRSWYLCVALLVTAACRGATTVSPDSIPFRIKVIAGNGQTAAVNSELPNWIRFLVTDLSGTPVSGAQVLLDTGTDEGETLVQEMITDGTGSVITHWTLGPLSGTRVTLTGRRSCGLSLPALK